MDNYVEHTLISGTSRCSDKIVVTLNLPKECPIDEEIIREYMKKIFFEGLLKNLCQNCALLKPDHQKQSE